MILWVRRRISRKPKRRTRASKSVIMLTESKLLNMRRVLNKQVARTDRVTGDPASGVSSSIACLCVSPMAEKCRQKARKISDPKTMRSEILRHTHSSSNETQAQMLVSNYAQRMRYLRLWQGVSSASTAASLPREIATFSCRRSPVMTIFYEQTRRHTAAPMPLLRLRERGASA